MPRRPIFVEVLIRADLDRVWELTQDPEQHARWDARFTRIAPLGGLDGGGVRFRYETRLPVLGTVRGKGTTIGERVRSDGTRTSALRFAPDGRRSPLGDGRGYWRYIPVEGGVRFVTGYDYTPNWGRPLDRVVRPVIGWLTAWSFDRLRIWAETGVEPERWPLRSALAVWRVDRPRAARTSRHPLDRAARTPPRTLTALEAP